MSARDDRLRRDRRRRHRRLASPPGAVARTPARFDAQVAEVRSAVDRGDRTAALQSLEDVALAALAAHDRGDITDDELAELAALVEVEPGPGRSGHPRPAVPETTTTTTTTAPTTTTPARTTSPRSRTRAKHDED